MKMNLLHPLLSTALLKRSIRMFTLTHRSGRFLAVGVFLIVAGPLADAGRPDFTLYGNEQLIVYTDIGGSGALWGGSMVTILPGGVLHDITAYNNSTVNVFGGTVSTDLIGQDASTVNFTAGSAFTVQAGGTLNFSGGTVGGLSAFGFGTLNFSGGYSGDLNAIRSEEHTSELQSL